MLSGDFKKYQYRHPQRGDWGLGKVISLLRTSRGFSKGLSRCPPSGRRADGLPRQPTCLEYVRSWERLTSLSCGLDYSWNCFTEPSPGFLCRNGPEFLALDLASRTEMLGSLAWGVQTGPCGAEAARPQELRRRGCHHSLNTSWHPPAASSPLQ